MSPFFAAVLPALCLALAGPLVLLSIVVRRGHPAAFWSLWIPGIVALVALPFAMQAAPIQVSVLFRFDSFALFFTGLLIAGTMAVAALAYGYMRTCDVMCEELYALLGLACTGGIAMASSVHFVSFVLGLELLSVSLYVMIGYYRYGVNALEAAMKYLVLASVSSAFSLLGLALLYFTFGTMELGVMASRLPGASGALTAAGTMLLLVGVGYKLAVVPFHLWTPDVYEGSSAPVAAFIAAVPKAAMLAFLFRFLGTTGLGHSTPVVLVIAILSAASMIAGNVLALVQSNVKRLLAYSSISHMGYALVALVATGPAALTGVVFYAVAYLVTVLGAFGVVSALSTAGAEWSEIEDYRGLFWRKPAASLLLAGTMLSLAGIPLTAGFIGKFLVLSASVGSTLWTLSVILVLTSAVGLYYYLRVVVIMFIRSEHAVEPLIPAIPMSGGLILVVLGLALAVFGVYPDPLISLIQAISFLPR